MKISLIAAISKNNVIGKDGKLPWHIPEDLKRFKELTSGHVVVMGRKTYESIGRPLPNRTNIIITRDPNYAVDPDPIGAEGIIIAHSLEEALKLAESNLPRDARGTHDNRLSAKVPTEADDTSEIFIIGGGQIYEQAMDLADKLYLTIVDEEIDGDTYFPDYSKFKKIVKVEEYKNENFRYRFLTLEK